MTFKAIDAHLSVAPQIRPEDLEEIVRLGFRSVVCNRPDGEAEDQPAFGEIEAAAKDLGLEARYLPIVPGQLGEEEASAFEELMNTLPKPMLAYCRSGARSTNLWSLTQA